VVKDAEGQVTELHCTYDPQTRGGNNPPDGRKVKGTLHWVSAPTPSTPRCGCTITCSPRKTREDEPEGHDWLENVNPESLTVLTGCKLEPSLADFAPGDPIQFERLGYFTPDTDSTPDQPVFNRTITLRDTWAKQKSRK
jgi:glutaminyl-tRNA synthetase